MDDDDDMEVEEEHQPRRKVQEQQPAKKVKVGEKPSSSSSAGGSSPIAAPLVLAPPPVPPPGPESATMKLIHSKLDAMWVEQKKEVGALKSENKAAFKHQSDLPLARIKRVMKSDEDVRMISAEAPILFAKACEMFVLDLTIRCYAYSEHNKRGGLEREDVYQVLKETDVFDFLAEVRGFFFFAIVVGQKCFETNAQLSPIFFFIEKNNKKNNLKQVLINHPVSKSS